MATSGTGLSAINHIVVLMLENRSFDHMLGFLYADAGNVSPAGQTFEGLTGKESNPGGVGSNPVTVFKIQPGTTSTYYMPGADPGEGYAATNAQLFASNAAPTPPVAKNQGFVSNFAATLNWESKNKSYSIVALRCATTGTARRPPKPCPIAPSSMRPPRKGTWTTRPRVSPRRPSTVR